MPQIEVTFSIDANGILEVKAKDKATGKEHKISIQAGSGMSEDDIQRMVDEAAANAADDERRAALATAKNEAEHHVHQTNKMLEEHQDKLQGDEEDKIKAAVAKLETAKDASDASKEKSTLRSTTANCRSRIRQAHLRSQRSRRCRCW